MTQAKNVQIELTDSHVETLTRLHSESNLLLNHYTTAFAELVCFLTNIEECIPGNHLQKLQQHRYDISNFREDLKSMKSK